MKGGLHLGVRKGAWTEEEDNLLRKCIQIYGEGNWYQVPRRAGLNRCRKSCRLRWLNYLRPNIKRGNFTFDEVDLIIRLQKLLGNRWSLIAGRLPGRTTNDVKNFWNTHMRKKLVAQEEERAKAHQKPMKYNNIVKPRPSTFSKNLIFPTGKSAITGNIQTKGNLPKPSRTSLLGDDRGAPPRQDGDMLDNLEMNSEISWFMGGSADQEPFQVPWSPGELTPAILAASESFVQGSHQSDWNGTFTCNLDLWDFLNDEQTVA